MDYCHCNHQASEHRDGNGLCRADDNDGERCGCTTFEYGPDTDPDGD